MANFGYFLVAFCTFILMTFIQQATALHCWNCDNARDPFCGDRFDYSMVTDQVENDHYHRCLGQRCLKVVYDVGMAQLVHRLCAKDDDDAHYVCDYFHQGSRCEVCSTDRCNGAAHLAPMALLIIIPMAIAKLFSSHVL